MTNADKKNRYVNIPVSEKTKANMSLTNDDIHFINRTFLIQDAVFEEQIENLETKILNALVKVLKDYNDNILARLDLIQEDVSYIKGEIKAIKQDVVDLYKEIDKLKTKINTMEKQIIVLETKIGCPNPECGYKIKA